MSKEFGVQPTPANDRAPEEGTVGESCCSHLAPCMKCGKDGRGNGLTSTGRGGMNPNHAEKLVDEL